MTIKHELGDLAALINKISYEHGFWPEDRNAALDRVKGLIGVAPGAMVAELKAIGRYIEAQEVRNFGEMIALAHSELSEALEAHRDGQAALWYLHTRHCPWSGPHPSQEPNGCKCQAKPEGVAVELADCIIRCLDTMKSLDVNIDEVVLKKIMYNDSRPYKHGRKY